ncbi:MFS transporter [Nocardia sp. NPDC003482]
MTTTETTSATRTYLASRGLALTGGSVAEAVLPLIVVVTLRGGTSAVGAVTATMLTVGLVTRIPLASWVDSRKRHITVQALAQILAAASACLIPLLWWSRMLTLPTLLASVVVVVSTKTLVASCGHSTLNSVVPPRRRTRAVGALNSMSSAADIVGSSAGPALTRLVPAPAILLVDAALNLLSAALLWPLRFVEAETAVAERVSEPGPHVPTTTLVLTVARRRDVWLLWLSGVVGSLLAPVMLVYLIRDLHVAPALVGVLLAFGAVGGIVGGLLAHRILRWLGMWPLIAASSGLSAVSTVCLLSAGQLHRLVYPLVILFEILSASAGTLLVAAVFGTLQTATARPEISRVMSIASTGMEGLALAGIAAGVALSTAWSDHAVIVVTASCYVILALCAAAAFLTNGTGNPALVSHRHSRPKTPDPPPRPTPPPR